MAERHVSRWRAPSEQTTGASRTQRPTNGDASTIVSLRYLDEFVRKLQCAPRLLEHHLFPDAKEITESMGLFNAVRRYLIHESGAGGSTTDLADGIVVVGDGNTPRSAAMFAYRLKDWKSYSIDPAMKVGTDEQPTSWSTIENLVVIRNKIENVRIRLRRAVVVLIHAHVTIEQALSAVEAQEIVGVVTMPCCNWYGKQEKLFGRHPDVVYDDFSILSDHRELRVWINPRAGDGVVVAPGLVAVDQSGAIMKGCVRKHFVADYSSSTSKSTTASDAQQTKKTKKENKSPASILSTLHGVMASNDDALPRNPLAAIADKISSAGRSRILVLSASGPVHGLAQQLPTSGSLHVYTLQNSSVVTDATTGTESLTAEILDITGESKRVVGRLLCATPPASDKVIVSMTPLDGHSPLEFDCVVDDRMIYRSLRNQPKKTSGAFFQRLVRLALQLASPQSTMSQLVVVSPRKDWRKPEFLASEQLAITFTSTQVPTDDSPLFIYSCSSSASALATTGTKKERIHDHKKQRALRLKEALEVDFFAIAGDGDATGTPTTSITTVRSVAPGERVHVQGIVQHLRRYTTGPSFISIAASAASSFQDHLQVSLDPERLHQWTTAELTLDAVLRLLHKGDSVELVGFIDLNSQDQPMLRLDALRFLQSEFQAYQ